MSEDRRVALDRAFRTAHGRLIAALTRRFGVAQLAVIETAVQDAGLRALEKWNGGELEGWLLRVAHNLVVDALRRERKSVPFDDDVHAGAVEPAPDLEPELDDELRLIFLCCHPAL